MASLFRRPRRAVIASAAKMSGGTTQYAKRLQEPWQDRALYYYDEIGELRYAAQFYARQVSRIRIFPAMLKPDGSTEPIEDGPPVEILNQIQDPGGGRSRLQYDYGRLMFVTGEGMLFGDKVVEQAPTRWRFLWRDEVETDDGGTSYRKTADGKRAPGESGTAYRLWAPHPRQSDLADAPMRAVLNVAEELVLLSDSVRSTAVTRMTKGILALAQELSPSPADPGADEDPEQNPFLKAAIDHLQAQIDNPADAASMVPFLIEAPYEYIERGIQWIKLHDPATDYLERDLRVELIKRLALGLDMPPEVLLGMTDANHWTAKQVQHDMWRSHGIAVAERFCDDLNDAYLRPALLEDNFAEAENVVVAYDDSEVVISPDRTEDADNALDRAAISFSAYRRLKGIPEDDKPSDEEVALILAMKTRNPNLLPGDIPLRGPLPAQTNGKPPPEAGPPEPSGGRLVSRQEARTASILGAAQLALMQCRAKAGSRLRQHVSRPKIGCEECQRRIESSHNTVVASMLGMDTLTEIGKSDPIALVKGGTSEFQAILEEWGIERSQAMGLCQRLEAYAAATLFEEQQPDLPPGYAALVDHAAAASEITPLEAA